MASTDLKNNIDGVQSIKPDAYTADATGASADLKDFDGALVVWNVGTWTDGTHTVIVEESADDSTFTAVADADLLGTEPVVDAATEDEQVYRVGYIGSKQFLRVKVTVAGATTGMKFGAVIVRGAPREAPVA